MVGAHEFHTESSNKSYDTITIQNGSPRKTDKLTSAVEMEKAETSADNEQKGHSQWRSLWFEICDLSRLGVSLVVSQFFLFFQTAVTVAAAGQLGTSQQAAIALAVSFFNVTVLAITMGLATASDALLSQAFGSPFKKMVGVFFQRSAIFFFLAFLVVTTINMYSDVIFVSFGQDPMISCIARYYLVMLTPGVFGLYVFRLTVVYYRIQDYYWPIVLSTAAGFATTAGSGYVLVFVYDFGVDGIAISNDFGYLVMGFSLVAYALLTKTYEKTCDGLSMQAFDGWLQYAELGSAGIVLVASEYIFGEILIFMAGTMGPVELSSQMIVFQTFLVCGVINFGFSVACTVKVGNFLGGNQPQRAKRAVVLTVVVAIIPMSISVMTAIICRHQLARIFSSDEDTVETVAYVLIYCMLCSLVDTFYTNLNGALRGCARQGLASVVNVVGMYGVGVPILFIFKLTDNLTLPYTWLTFTSSEALIVSAFMVILLRTDWDKQAQLAHERVQSPASKNHQKSYDSIRDTGGVENTAINQTNVGEQQSKIRASNVVIKVLIIVIVLICTMTACILSLTADHRPTFTPLMTSRVNQTTVHCCQYY